MITGPKKLVKRAKYFAKLFNIRPEIEFAFTDNDKFSETICYEDGTFKILIQDWVEGPDMTRIIAHEMVHVWQYARGSLEAIEETQTFIWEGKLYTNSDSMEEYLLRPWEMEARALEDYCEWKWRNK